MMLTTGMLMFGKMSVGVRKIDNVPRIKIRIASTTNVYGRFNATLTIHIVHAPNPRLVFLASETRWCSLDATVKSEQEFPEVVENTILKKISLELGAGTEERRIQRIG